MTLEALADQHRVPVRRDECGDPIVRGRNGHLYMDTGRIMVCFTDDGRKVPFKTRLFKNRCLGMLPGIRLTQDGDYEFIGEILEDLVSAALFKVLRVKRFKATKGQPRPAAMQRHLFQPRSTTQDKRLRNAPAEGTWS